MKPYLAAMSYKSVYKIRLDLTFFKFVNVNFLVDLPNIEFQSLKASKVSDGSCEVVW